MPPDTALPSWDNLLWDPALVTYFLARDDSYRRIIERSQQGIPTLTAQAYAEIATIMHRRSLSPQKIALNLEELQEFVVVPLDRVAAEAFALTYGTCLANARNRGLDAPEPWFVWNVALYRLHGCRILTNDRAHYAGLVAPEALV